MDWNELKVLVNYQSADAVANILNESGASGVVMERSSKNKGKGKVDFRDCKEAENMMKISAYYPVDDQFHDKYTSIKNKVEKLKDCGLDFKGADYQVNLVEEEDWATSWHEYFTPTRIGNNFLICPSWIDPPETERTIIEIDPGQAFGVGTHESTQLAVSFLEKYIPQYTKDSLLLDVGIGTGILSIVSAKMGIKHIVGIDISEPAIRTASENTKINGVNQHISLKEKDIKAGIHGSYSIIVANLLPDIISELLPHLVKYFSSDCIMILSGIIEKKEDEIIKLCEKQNLEIIDKMQMGEWVSLVTRKG